MLPNYEKKSFYHMKKDFMDKKIYILIFKKGWFWISDRSERDFSNENINHQNLKFQNSFEKYKKKSQKLTKFQWFRKEYSYQTIKDDYPKFS